MQPRMALSGHGDEQIKEKLNSQRGIKFRVRAKSLRILALNVGFNRFTSVNSARTPPRIIYIKTLFIVYVTFHYIITSVNSARTPPEDDFNDLRKADRADCQFPGETSEPDHTIGAIAFRCKFCNPQNSFKK